MPFILEALEQQSQQHDEFDWVLDEHAGLNPWQFWLFDQELSLPASSPQLESSQFDKNWLLEFCQRLANSGEHAADYLCENILSSLRSAIDDNQLQNNLLDLLGFDQVENISSIIAHKEVILSSSSVTTTLAEDPLTKIIKGKDLKKARHEALTTKKIIPLQKGQEKIIYPFVFSSEGLNPLPFSLGGGLALPPGTSRVNTKDYEQICIPISTTPHRFEDTMKEKKVEELDSICRECFKSFSTLNKVQSIVYDTAIKTNENLLICAPTGAGKTEVALMTIIRTISLNMTTSVAPPAYKFKIIYVAPMKALVGEIVRKLGKRLDWLGIQVRELTGDIQLSKAEIITTHIIVTTPEKWDVVTRKGVGDTELSQKVQLLIIDEVHLLNDERGAVIESIIARTLRQVETTQSMIRIVGLSATLPNYIDVAAFLRVNPMKGMFYFDGRFRPVPLEQNFLGVKKYHPQTLNRICYEKVRELMKEGGGQVLVFVHSRKDTALTAKALAEIALAEGDLDDFSPESHEQYEFFRLAVAKSRNKELKEAFIKGFGVHHAGMLRGDRDLVEKLFAKGIIRVLCCTATLAWGVNLPAYGVVIKGTQVYDQQRGGFVDLSVLDVLQIFGRAGRPQFEDRGVGYILTSHDKLQHYLSSCTLQTPIESKFTLYLQDNLNAEIVLGTVTNVEEGISWLSYSYLIVRMRKNPLVYGLTNEDLKGDPTLEQRRRDLIIGAARLLHKNQMIIFNESTGGFKAKDLGRISSAYYVKSKSIETFNSLLKIRMTEADVLATLSQSSEFETIKFRDGEEAELARLRDEGACCKIKDPPDTAAGKINILLQSWISRLGVDDFALISDRSYVVQNATRIIRALFEITLHRNWAPVSAVLLRLSKAIELQMWSFECPLRPLGVLSAEIIRKLEAVDYSIERLQEMSEVELGELVRFNKMGSVLYKTLRDFPRPCLEARVVPLTRSILQIFVTFTLDPRIQWQDRTHGASQRWWVWLEDEQSEELYYWQDIHVTRLTLREEKTLECTIPVEEPLPAQIHVRAQSDRWFGAETVLALSFKKLILPEMNPVQTDLLDLQPLPISALRDPELEKIYKFKYFNPVQTQVFYQLYQTDINVLIGAPTGSGKTIMAELALWRALRSKPDSKVVYIAPMKALVKERVQDWSERLGKCNVKVVELTGETSPSVETIKHAQVVITTPEKWDGLSRGWQFRSYVKSVSLVIIDEIHLLGSDRGPILEVICSRLKFISHSPSKNNSSTMSGDTTRIVGLSTALSNAQDLAHWLGIPREGLYNFSPSVRPVPLEVYVDGFSLKQYCPRMASMNKPAFDAIKTHSPSKPVIIFVSSRRQTRLTAKDLIAYCALEERRFLLELDQDSLDDLGIKDAYLRHALSFGIGLHHAGLAQSDRRHVERLFVQRKIQVLIATSTLAWGVNFPAHLVIVKGTEYYDASTKGYVEMSITDVLQMLGRAGRPQFDSTGIARVFVQESKRNFYKKFLHSPFPVESRLHLHLADHLNAEVAATTIASKQDALDYLTWTFLYRRLLINPSYYAVPTLEDEEVIEQGQKGARVTEYLSELIDRTFAELADCYCVDLIGSGRVEPTPLGKLSSFYYLSHSTVKLFRSALPSVRGNDPLEELLYILSEAAEFNDHPVRHNEDIINAQLSVELPFKTRHIMSSPHTKVFLLLQAYLWRRELPSPDYETDTKSALDQSARIILAMVDIAAIVANTGVCLACMRLVQIIKTKSISTWKQFFTEETKLGDKVNLLDYYKNFTKFKRLFLSFNHDVKDFDKVCERLKKLEGFTTFQFPSTVQANQGEKMYRLEFTTVSMSTSRSGQMETAWWVLISKDQEPFAIKRINPRPGRHTRWIEFEVPPATNNSNSPVQYHFQAHCVCDSFQGLDQTFSIALTMATTTM